jgi:hypothetical protein
MSGTNLHCRARLREDRDLLSERSGWRDPRTTNGDPVHVSIGLFEHPPGVGSAGWPIGPDTAPTAAAGRQDSFTSGGDGSGGEDRIGTVFPISSMTRTAVEARTEAFLVYRSLKSGVTQTEDLWLLPLTPPHTRADPLIQTALQTNWDADIFPGRPVESSYRSDEFGPVRGLYLAVVPGVSNRNHPRDSGRRSVPRCGIPEFSVLPRWRAVGRVQLFFIGPDAYTVMVGARRTPVPESSAGRAAARCSAMPARASLWGSTFPVTVRPFVLTVGVDAVGGRG